MIAAFETYVLDRLGVIKLQGATEDDPSTAIPIYGLGPDRPKGKTMPPCIAVSRHIPPRIDVAMTRPNFEVFTRSEEEFTFQIPDYMGGGEITGPANWAWKPFPTPLILSYQFDLLAISEAQALGLFTRFLDRIPAPYQVVLDDFPDQAVSIIPDGPPENLDELEKPLYRWAMRYSVSNIWIDRLTEFTVPGIRDLDMGFGTTG